MTKQERIRQSLINASLLNVQELERQEWALRTLLGFGLYVRKDFKPFHHTKIVTSELEEWAFGDCLRLILTMGPQYGKSAWSSVLLPAYILGRDPDARILLLSYGASLSSDFNAEVQKVMNSPEYHSLFPSSVLNPENIRTFSDKPRRNSDMIEIPGHRGMFVNAGIGGSYTGKGFTHIILDDLIKSRDEADSPTYRDTTDSAYTDTIRTRRANDRTRILILNTRWHLDDLTGRRLRAAQENPLIDQWRVVNMPALLSECDDIEAERWKFPEGQESGKEVLWPEHFSYEDVIATKAENPFNFAAQYMGTPTSREGNAIKREWFEDGSPTKYLMFFEPSEIVAIVLRYDVAFTDAVSGDWTWGSLKAKTKDGKFITLWQHFGHWSNEQRREALAQFGSQCAAMIKKIFPHLRWNLGLEAGVGAGVDVIEKDVLFLTSRGIPAKTIPVSKIAKAVRANSWLQSCENGSTKLYAGTQLAEFGMSDGINRWINPFLNSALVLRYTDDGLNFVGGKDDMIDAEDSAHDALAIPPNQFVVAFS